MTRRKNVKRIDPRYFLNETVDRNDDGSPLDEQSGIDPKFDPAHLQKLGMVEWTPSFGEGGAPPDGGKPGLAADNNGVLLAVANPKPGSRKYSYWVHHGRVGNLQSLGWQEGNIWIPEEAVRAADIAFGRNETANRGELEEGFKGYFTRKPKPHQLVNKLAYLLGDEDSMKASTLKGLMSLSFGLRSKDFLRGIWVSRKDKDAARKKMERTLPRTGFWKRIFKADPDEQDAYIDLMTEYAMDWLKSGHDKADMMPFLAKLIKAKAGDDIEKILDAGKSAEKQRRADSDKYASDQAAEKEKNVAASRQKEAVWEKISDKGYHSAVDGDDAELVANTLEAVYPGGLDLWITIANNSSSNKDIRHGQWDGHNARDRNWKKAQKQGRELMALNWSGMLPYKAAEKVKSIIHDFISARARPSYNDVEDAEERYQAQEKGHKNWQEGRETWSSYKDAQVLSENWRKYMSEDKKE